MLSLKHRENTEEFLNEMKIKASDNVLPQSIRPCPQIVEQQTQIPIF